MNKITLKTSSGLSLLETVIVLGLSVFLMLSIYGTFLISNKSFYTSDRKLEITQNGRITLDRLSREIRQSVEIVTALPPNKSDPLFPPPHEIQFQDGHDITSIQYIRYYLDSFTHELKRQKIIYFFSAEPTTYVYWNTVNQFGQLPQSQITEERVIAEYFDNIIYYGSDLITIEVYLQKQNSTLHLLTLINGRNSR